ncbi:MAG: hypothetical protein IT427_10610 [Pirellulales bacterium]|nr:hypothetical protein [Pirellulales bacterium]
MYSVTDLNLPSEVTLRTHGINDAGVVVGAIGMKPFRWSPQTGVQQLSIPNGFSSAKAIAVNNSGQIAVSTIRSLPGVQYAGHAFRWESGSYTDLGTLGGTYSTAYGIDDSGRVAGFAYSPTGIHAYRSTTGSALVDIDSLGGGYSLAYGINSVGQVVGQAYNAAQQYHSFLWNGSGSMIDLGTLGGSQSQAQDISDSGEYIVGDSETSAGAYHAFIWKNGVFTDLGSPTPHSSYGYAVNNSGTVIGNYHYQDDLGNTFGRPYVWDTINGMRDPNDLLDPVSGQGWILNELSDLNNQGQIVGTGWHNGVLSAYVLTPVVVFEPSQLLLFGSALPVLLPLLRRKRSKS